MFKTNSEIIKIEARTQAEIKTGVTFWSHDRGTAKLIFKLIKDGVPQSIPEGTTVPIRLIFKSKTAQDGFGKHDYLATVEDRVNGIVSIILEDNILGYIGEVKGSIYLNLPGNRSLDTAGRFNFSIQRSPIDDSTPELEDYYFNGFSQTIDKIEEMISQAENRIDGKVDQIESEIEVLEGKVDQAQGTFDRIEDDLKETGKLKKVYSNSIDFGDYDYSGNPNLFLNKLKSSDFIKGTHGSLTDDDGILHFTSDGTGDISMFTTTNAPAIVSGKTYTISARLRFDEGTTGDINKLRLVYRKTLGGDVLLEANSTSMTIDDVGKEITIKGTAKVAYQITNLERFYISVSFSQNGKINGGFKLSHIKIEEGSTATPYQPNLLESPWELSSFLSNPNLLDPTKSFPIVNSNYMVYDGRRVGKWESGKTYTVSMKAQKPGSQRFDLYLGTGTVRMGSFDQVEGKVDEWKITFTLTQSNIDAGAVDILRVYQYPSTSLGSCRIDWLKLEDGPVATPLIKEYKYQGLGQTRTSIDKYLWKPFEIKNEFYSNDINFGDHDYSGNPNLAPNLTFNSFTVGGSATKVDGGEYIKFHKPTGTSGYMQANFPYPKLSTNHTLSVEVYIEETTVANLFYTLIGIKQGSTPSYTNLIRLTNQPVGQWVTLSNTAISPANAENPQLLYVYTRGEDTMDLRIRYTIKLEEGSEATPYQPNLLDAPYYLSRAPLGKNIASPGATFPITTSDETLYGRSATEDFIVGQTYVVTMKATKPATQSFVCYLSEKQLGTFKPVEGLTDVWTTTIKIGQLGNNKRAAYILQKPNTTLGACQIDWIKIEKGDTRTPNILRYKYRGVNNFVSKNLKDYTWDINNDYAQQIFDDTVSLTKPQTIISAKNFEEVPTVKNQPVHYGPQLFEGWYGSGTEHAGMGTKARPRVGGLVVDGRDQLSEPLTWNEGRYEATANRDVTFYCKGTMYVEMGSNVGKYLYIANWKNSEQTQYASGMPAGIGTNLDGGLFYRNMLDFSWVVQLKQGDKFSIGIELADGKTVSKIQIRTLHIKELVSPTN